MALGQLQLTGVTIAIGAHALISSFDLAIAPGERTTVMGPSGSGKSTLLAFIAGTIDPTFAASGFVRSTASMSPISAAAPGHCSRTISYFRICPSAIILRLPCHPRCGRATGVVTRSRRRSRKPS